MRTSEFSFAVPIEPQPHFPDQGLTQDQLRKKLGNNRANDPTEYDRTDSGARERAPNEHHHRQIYRFAAGGRRTAGLCVESLTRAARPDRPPRASRHGGIACNDYSLTVAAVSSV